MSQFKSAAEFKKVFEHIFVLMNEHPDVGRTLRDAQAPHKFEITDFKLEFHVTYADAAAEKKGKFLKWQWGEPEWEPMISLIMTSDVANRFFQGKENIATAVMFGRVKLKGPMTKILELAPVSRPVYPVYRKWLEDEGLDHLLV